VSTNPTVSFDVKDEEWFVLGEPRRCNRSGQLLLHETDLAKISATDLQSALRRSCANYSADDEQVLVSDVPLTFFDRDSPPDFSGPNSMQGFLLKYLANPTQDTTSLQGQMQAFWDSLPPEA